MIAKDVSAGIELGMIMNEKIGTGRNAKITKEGRGRLIKGDGKGVEVEKGTTDIQAESESIGTKGTTDERL